MIGILGPLIAILVAFLAIFIYSATTRKRMIGMAETIKGTFNPDRIKALDKTLDRVYIIAKANPKYSKISRELNTIHDNYETALNRGKRLCDELLMEANAKKLNPALFHQKYESFESKILKIREIERQFFDASLQVTQQDEYIRNEFAFYQVYLRKIYEEYEKSKILLVKIAGEITAFKLRIKELEKEFEKVMQSADTVQADKILRLYGAKVKRFALIVSEGPAINSYLFDQIPHGVERMKKLYEDSKLKKEDYIDFIDFKNPLKKVSNKYNDAHKVFKKLDIEKAKKDIIEILKVFRGLENKVNMEIKSRNIFMKKNDPVIQLVKDSLIRYSSIKNQLNEMVSKGKTLSHNAIEQYNNVKRHAKELDLITIKYLESLKTSNDSFLQKIEGLDFLVRKTKNLTVLLNDLMKIVWTINIEEIRAKNTFKRSESALHEVVANIKKYKVFLKKNEQEELNNLVEIKTNLSDQILSGNINKELINKINAFSTKATTFYTLVMGNVQIAIHTVNMLKELAPERSHDHKLNVALQNAEREYLDGDYAQSLNNIINAVWERGN